MRTGRTTTSTTMRTGILISLVRAVSGAYRSSAWCLLSSMPPMTRRPGPGLPGRACGASGTRDLSTVTC
ncbi:hypothetical protein SMICM304S_02790 [Streptomyces microflavus]